MTLSAAVDAVLLVVRADVASREQLHELSRALTSTQVDALGFVLAGLARRDRGLWEIPRDRSELGPALDPRRISLGPHGRDQLGTTGYDRWAGSSMQSTRTGDCVRIRTSAAAFARRAIRGAKGNGY